MSFCPPLLLQNQMVLTRTTPVLFSAFGGQSSYDVGSVDDVDEAIVSTVDFLGGFAEINESSLDEKDTSFGVVAGYRFNSYFGLEVGYVDLGAAEYSAEGVINVGGPTLGFEADASFEASGPTASVVGVLPVSGAFDLYGKGGIFFSSGSATTIAASTAANTGSLS